MKAFCDQNNISIINIDERKKLGDGLDSPRLAERKARNWDQLYCTIKYFGESTLALEYVLNFAKESISALMLAKSKLIFNTSTRINFWWLLMLIGVVYFSFKFGTISINSHQKLILVEVLKINFDFANIKADILSLAKLRTYSRAKVDSPKYFIVQYIIGLSF